MKNERDLLVPDEVLRDRKAVEVLRAWVANEGLVCALRPTAWPESSSWGIVLADAARHVANARRDEVGEDPEVTIAKIREVFNLELGGPADGVSGEFVE
jgi:hypothetical protein